MSATLGGGLIGGGGRLTYHLSGQEGILLSEDQQPHHPAHRCPPEQRHHFLLGLAVNVHAIHLSAGAAVGVAMGRSGM